MGGTERVQTLGQYVDVLRRRWPYLATIIPGAILFSVFIAFVLPPMYRSSAAILLEPSSIDSSLVKTSIVSYADQQIELVKREVLTTERLQDIVAKIDPYPALVDASASDKAALIAAYTYIQKVDPVTMQPLMQSSAFTVNYSNESPAIAKTVTGHLANLFLEYNREVRTRQAAEAYDFLLANSEVLESQMLELERRISEFKMKYGEALPEAQGRNQSSLDRVERDYDSLQAQIRLVEQQESMLKLQLDQISPTLVTDKGGDIYTQLGTLRAELAQAQQKYTPEHPDVKRLKRAIETLAAEAKLGNPQNVRPDNPEYMRVSSELDAVRTNLAALRSNAARAQQQITEYESRLTQTPGVEREYIQVMREREIAQAQYAELQQKLRTAKVSQTLESQAKGERYTLISNAYTPLKPDSPNRLGIILLGFILGGGLAVGLVAFRESADPTVRASYDVADMTDLPLIGAVPSMANAAERTRRRLLWGGVAGVYGIVTVIVAAVVVNAS